MLFVARTYFFKMLRKDERGGPEEAHAHWLTQRGAIPPTGGLLLSTSPHFPFQKPATKPWSAVPQRSDRRQPSRVSPTRGPTKRSHDAALCILVAGVSRPRVDSQFSDLVMRIMLDLGIQIQDSGGRS